MQSDRAVEVDTNSYSVPWRLIGESVQVTVSGDQFLMSFDRRIRPDPDDGCGRAWAPGKKNVGL